MHKHQNVTIRLFALLLMCLLASMAKAQIGAVAGGNTPSQVAITATGHSLINWSIVDNVANPGPTGVSSAIGTFFAPDNSILGTVNIPLQASRNVQVSGATTFIINEPLTIPQSVIRQAQKKGFGSFAYVRQFTDSPDNTTQSGVVTFTISGGGAVGELSVRRVAMEYDDGRISEVLAPHSELHARAVVSYNGTGLLEYSWEVASPPSTQGQPVFVPLVSRKQFLLAGDQVVLQTPRLPTGHNGDYLVRLRIDKPVPNFDLPLLRYAINSSGQSRPETRIASLQVARPAPDAVLAPDTLFAWQPVTDASAYQLELYTRPVRDRNLPGGEQQSPVTGVLVPAAKTQLTVGSLSRAHLLPSSTYYWRVVAVSDQGQIIARSDFRRIQFQ